MKQLLFTLLLLTVFTLQSFGQEKKDSTSFSDNVLNVTVPQKLKIKDKIFLVNKSPYLILQAMVALPKPDGNFEPLGTANVLAPDETSQVASYDNNWLKNLRGKTLSIKVKAAKVFTAQSRTGVATPMGDVGVAHTEISSDLINNIDPKDITYSFNVKFYEANHDLYIEVYYKGDGKNVMDF